jgi:hypothetical protein
MKLDAPPTWKMHKYTAEEFQGFMGHISGSARWSYLHLCPSGSILIDVHDTDTTVFIYAEILMFVGTPLKGLSRCPERMESNRRARLGKFTIPSSA